MSSILDLSFKEELEKNVKPETKAAQMEHAIKKEISIRLDEDKVFYTSLKEKVEELIARYKERQMTIFELLEKLEEAKEAIVTKVSGKTESGLTSLQEPYYNKLLEVHEDREIYELKEIAIQTHGLIEQRVTPISDWTSKPDFKRKLTGDLTITLLKQKVSMDDAKMLSGYFMALAENQYGKK